VTVSVTIGWSLFHIDVKQSFDVVMIVIEVVKVVVVADVAVAAVVVLVHAMRRTCNIGPRKGTCSATSCIGFRAATSSAVLMVFMILGPFPGMIVKSTPNAGKGVKISKEGKHEA
jgi:hypothetical protein